MKHSPAIGGHRRTINVLMLAMLSMVVVINLRGLPLTATYGLSLVFFYLAAGIFFMVPYALISAELASGWPKAGGVYIWVREALGERWGFFAIWMQWFPWYPTTFAFVGAGLAYVFYPQIAENKIYLTSFILCGFWGITFLNFLGIKTSAWVSSVCLLLGTLLPGIILITLGILWIAQGNPVSIDLSAEKLIPEFHLSNLIFLAGIFLALSGLEVNANIAKDVKNPQKSYPRALFIAVIFSLCILILGSLSIAIVIPREKISLATSLFTAFATFLNLFHLSWLIPIIILLIVFGILGEANAWVMAGAKGLFATTEHGCLPPFFFKMNKRFVPTRMLIFQALVVTVSAAVFYFLPSVNISFWMIGATSAQMYILMYLLLFISGIVLRYKKPWVQRAYKIPFGNGGMWLAGIVGFCSSLFALFFSFFPPTEFKTGSILVYEILIISCLVVSCSIPLIIYQLRKPHWKAVVKEES